MEVINLKHPFFNRYGTRVELVILKNVMTLRMRNANISFSQFKSIIDSFLNYPVSEIKLRIAYDYAVKHHDDCPPSFLEIEDLYRVSQINEFT